MAIGTRGIFDEDHDMFRENARKFFREQVAPNHKGFEAAGKVDRETWRACGQMGLLGVSIPTEKGGAVGGSFKDEAIVLEEQVYAHCHAPAIPVHSTIVMPYFANYGTPEQVERFLPALSSGEMVGAIAMTEPDAGSDLQGIRTRAVRDGDDHYVINGSKVFITNGILADVVVVVTITDPEAKSNAHGITLFAVEEGMPGFKKGRNLNKLGMKGHDTAELFFEDLRVPKTSMVGGLNKGFYHLMTELPQERLALAITGCAHAEWMFEETRAYVNDRKAFGGRLSSLQTIQHRLAELKTAIAVCRTFVDECIDLHEHGLLNNASASMAKYWATELENKVATECLQMHGGWGYMTETKISRSYADARVQTIYGGSNEIMKELVARSIVTPSPKN